MSFREEFAAGGTCFPETWENGKGKILQPVCIVLHFRDGAVLRKLAAISLSFQKSKTSRKGKRLKHTLYTRQSSSFLPFILSHTSSSSLNQSDLSDVFYPRRGRYVKSGKGSKRWGRNKGGKSNRGKRMDPLTFILTYDLLFNSILEKGTRPYLIKDPYMKAISSIRWVR